MSLHYSIYKVQCSLLALAVSLLTISRALSFVKNFFQVFSNFFVVTEAAFVQALQFRAALADSSHILARTFPFVNTFFHLFSFIFGFAGPVDSACRPVAFHCEAAFSASPFSPETESDTAHPDTSFAPDAAAGFRALPQSQAAPAVTPEPPAQTARPGSPEPGPGWAARSRRLPRY